MDRFKRILLSVSVTAMLVMLFTCVSMAADEAGCFKVYKDGWKSQVKSLTFKNGEELNELFDDYDSSSYDLYVQLYKDLNLGGTNGEPLLIDTDSDVEFNLNGHRIYRSFSDKNRLYNNGNVMEISPGRDDCKYVIYSDENSDRTKDNPTSEPALITGGQNDDDGGGIYFDDGGKVYLNNISVSGNKAEEGGGIYANDTDLTVYLENGTVLANNTASKGGGGAYLYWGKMYMNGEDVEISRNESGHYAGGVYISGGLFPAELEMKSGKICENIVKTEQDSYKGKAAMGGGIYSSGRLTIASGEISGNRAVYVNDPEKYGLNEEIKGGGIYIGGRGNRISNAIIKDNAAENRGLGGGIYHDGWDELVLDKVTVSNNLAGIAGGMYLDDNTTIKDSEIIRNKTYDFSIDAGAGIYLNSHKLNLINTDISYNEASGYGGGIYADGDVYAECCTITFNKANQGSGVYLDSEYDFHAKKWCRIISNFKWNNAYDNLHLGDGDYTTAYLDINGITDFDKTLIYVTSEVENNKIRISTNADKLLSNRDTEKKILGCIGYDNNDYDVVSDQENLYASKGHAQKCTVHFIKESTIDTDGTIKREEASTAVYPKGYTLFKGTVLNCEMDVIHSYDAVYKDNPVESSEQKVSSIKICDALNDGNVIDELKYKDITVKPDEKNLSLINDVVQIDKDWVLNEDVYVIIRVRDFVSELKIDVPKVVAGQPLPKYAYIININGINISQDDEKIELPIKWENNPEKAEQGTKYKGRVDLPQNFEDKDVKGYHFFYTSLFPTCIVTLDGGPLKGFETSRYYMGKIDFSVTTDKAILTDIEWPDSIAEFSEASLGEAVPEASLPKQVNVAYRLEKPDKTVETKTMLVDTEITYPEGFENERKSIVTTDNYGAEIFNESCGNYSFSYSLKLPGFIDASEYEKENSLSKTYCVTVAPEQDNGLPALGFSVDRDKDMGSVKFGFTHPDGNAVVYSERHYASGTEPGAFNEYDSAHEFELSIDSEKITECKAKHEKYSELYCIEAQALENITEGFGDKKAASQKNRWYVEVIFDPDTYELTVENVEDSELFPGNFWVGDDEKYTFYKDENVSITAEPAVDGQSAAGMKFLRWEGADELITADKKTAASIMFTMPDENVSIKAVYAPMVKEIKIDLSDDPETTTAPAEIIFIDGTSKSIEVEVEWECIDDKHIAKIIIDDQDDKGIYIDPEVKVKINDKDVETKVDEGGNPGKLVTETEYEVPKKEPVIAAPTARELTYNGDSQKLVSGGNTDMGTMLYALGTETEAGNYSEEVPTAVDAGTYHVWYYVKGNEGQEDTDAQMIEVKIYKSDQNKPDKAREVSVSKNSITLQEQEGQGKTLYGCSEDTDTAAENISYWQESNVFDNLTSGTEYVFYVKFSGNQNVKESSASKSSIISTEAEGGEDNPGVEPGDNPGTVVPSQNIAYTITYDSNGGTEFKSEIIKKGKTVNLDKVPVKEGFEFTGWYSDKECTEKLESIKVSKNMTVYAGWKALPVEPDDDNDNDDNPSDSGHSGVIPSVPVPSVFIDEHNAYVMGYSDGSIKPEKSITRAEVATIFFRILKEDVKDEYITTENDFADVAEDAWYCEAVSTLANMGILNGDEKGNFNPDKAITRAEFAAVAARFADNKNVSSESFSDLEKHWAGEEVGIAHGNGWVNGYPDGTFRPDKYINRAEAMTMINRILHRIPENVEDLNSGMTVWSDNSNVNAWYYLAVQEATNSHDYEVKKNGYEIWNGIVED